MVRPLRLLLLAAPLLGCAPAQTLLPLDSRPATRVLPALVAGLLGPVQVPPAALLGTAGKGADPGRLREWLAAQPQDQPLLVALDALAYGGLVQSRGSTLTAAQATANLEPLRAWQQQTGQAVYAFITLPRQPEATDRARNLAVVRQMMEWAGQGVFRELHVTWDDALPGSPAPQEGAELAKVAPPNVHVYPGADEVMSLLVARALAPQPRTVRFVYSDPAAAQQVVKYEGVALSQSALNHAQAAGFSVTAEPGADLTLFVYNGGDSRQAALQVSALLRRGKVAVADVAQVNLGNAKMWRDLTTLQRPANLQALAAWGTPGNNLGTALAHAKMALEHPDPARQDALLAHEYANDIIYSTRLRAELRKIIPENQMNTPAAQEALLRLVQGLPVQMGSRYAMTDPALPWGRSFEWEFELQRQ